MRRPTIALACIMKNERHNIERLLKSVEGCFDEIHLTDTGSTDGTKEYAMSHEAKTLASTPIFVKDFTWIEDFAAARNHSMKDITTDYVMWMDLDDVLSSKEEFCRWRDHVMMLSDFWLSPYYYSFDENGNPNCTFIRERVIKTSKKFEWQYFIHEGMIAKEHVQANFVNNWQVHHKRTKEDYDKDFLRNVSMLEKRAKTENLPTRLKFYYGKELFDKGRLPEAYVWLDQIVDAKDLEFHDRILTFEYLIRACLQRFLTEEAHKPDKKMDLVVKALSLSMQAVVLAPTRAEFYCLAGDCLVQMGKDTEAIPMYQAACACKPTGASDASFIFSNKAAYGPIPKNMISRIKFKMGDLEGAIIDARDSFKTWPMKETEELLAQLISVKERVQIQQSPEKIETDEIVFSCLPGSCPYQFDDEVYKKKGIGGSETALVEVAKSLRKLTYRSVIVFNDREDDYVSPDGVHYRPVKEMETYFSKYRPGVHIAWRHNVKLTDAPTYLWCHDLYTPGAEVHSNYKKHICLTDFHKNYVMVQQQIPESKIHISSNGVNKERFGWVDLEKKNKNKIIFSSSPDRGLDRAIEIVELARKYHPDLELHAFYGMDNMKKMGGGFAEKARHLEDMMKTRPWVKFHGNVDQKTLAEHMKEAVVWLYPANFIETYCITAIEALYAKCFPLVREIGALKNTLRPFHEKEMARLLFLDASTDAEKSAWAAQLCYVIEGKEWEKINMEGLDYSWEKVARDFMSLMGIEEDKKPQQVAIQGQVLSEDMPLM